MPMPVVSLFTLLRSHETTYFAGTACRQTLAVWPNTEN